MAMFMLYANTLVSFMGELQALENEIASRWRLPLAHQQHAQRLQAILEIISKADVHTNVLSCISAARQLGRIRARLEQAPISGLELSAMFTELRVRVGEELEDRVFFCVSDPARIHRFFKRESQPPYAGCLVYKSSDEVFDPAVLDRFPEIEDDVAESCCCFVHHRFTGCVFHLMRIVECGVVQVGKLAGNTDPKPSWGSILSKLDKYAYRTEYKDLPATIQPNIESIKRVLPTLHAIQHAWRNKVTHVENRLIPTNGISEEIALEIMNAVQAFMRTLATELSPVTTSSA